MRFWIVADSDRRPPSAQEAAAGWRWRRCVDLAFPGTGVVVAVSSTAPKENHAAVLTPAEALSTTWDEHLAQADAEWLRPWLLRTAAGEHDVEQQLLVEVHRRTGRAPESYEWDLAHRGGR